MKNILIFTSLFVGALATAQNPAPREVTQLKCVVEYDANPAESLEQPRTRKEIVMSLDEGRRDGFEKTARLADGSDFIYHAGWMVPSVPQAGWRISFTLELKRTVAAGTEVYALTTQALPVAELKGGRVAKLHLFFSTRTTEAMNMFSGTLECQGE